MKEAQDRPKLTVVKGGGTSSTDETRPEDQIGVDDEFIKLFLSTLVKNKTESASDTTEFEDFLTNSRGNKYAEYPDPIEPIEEAMVDKDYVDSKNEASQAKLEASEARLRSDFVAAESRIESRLDNLAAKLDKLPTLFSSISLAVGTVVTIAGIVIAVIGISFDRFDGGWSASSGYASQLEVQKASIEKIDSRFDKLEEKISLIATSLSDNQGDLKQNAKKP